MEARVRIAKKLWDIICARAERQGTTPAQEVHYLINTALWVPPVTKEEFKPPEPTIPPVMATTGKVKIEDYDPQRKIAAIKALREYLRDLRTAKTAVEDRWQFDVINGIVQTWDRAAVVAFDGATFAPVEVSQFITSMEAAGCTMKFYPEGGERPLVAETPVKSDIGCASGRIVIESYNASHKIVNYTPAHRIEAIKTLRFATNMELYESKKMIEDGGNLPVNAGRCLGSNAEDLLNDLTNAGVVARFENSTMEPAPVPESGSIGDRSGQMRILGCNPQRKIEAIKMIRVCSGLGLREAKDLVEHGGYLLMVSHGSMNGLDAQQALNALISVDVIAKFIEAGE